jgi:hypothetical protein
MYAFTGWFEAESASVRGFCIEAQKFYGTEGKGEFSDAELSCALERYAGGQKSL